MRTNLFLFIIVSLIFTLTAQAQRINTENADEKSNFCATLDDFPKAAENVQQSIEQVKKSERVKKLAQETISIPVYVHIISDTNGTGNVADSKIQEQLTILNNSFRGTTGGAASPFEFVLLDIDRTAWIQVVSATFLNCSCSLKYTSFGV